MPRERKLPPAPEPERNLESLSIQGPPQKKAPPLHDPHGPFMPHPLDGAGFLARLEDAKTIEEWNEGLVALLHFLFFAASPQGADYQRMMLWSQDIGAFIAGGFKPPSNRPEKKRQAQDDAAFLERYFGVEIRNMYLKDAVNVLRMRENIPEERDIRARVRRAEAQLGYELKRGEPKD